MPGQRKTPIRSCVACRSASEKRGLIRVVRTPVGEVTVDPTGRMPGRGAYLCGSKECLALAFKTNKLGRALKCDVPERIKTELRELVVKDDDGNEREGNGDRAMDA